jgi:PA domain-containing protein
MRGARTLLVLAALGYATPAFANSTITIVNINAPGVGFNDPTPAAPVGGNPGTTVGQQRLIAFQFAADVWSAVLDSRVEIRIQASFEPLTCTPTSAVLGSAGTIQIFSNGPGEQPNTWYHVALANKLAGFDLAPGAAGTSADDIRARFNSLLNGNPACLGGTGWYYGLDLNHGTDIDLVTVLLHEFGHGLGFSTFVGANGSGILGLMDVYANNLFDDTTGKLWSAMTNAERAASILNPRNVVWVGPKVTAAVPTTLAPGTPLLSVIAPPSIAGSYQVGAASFGPPLSSPGLSGTVVLANDGVGATTDACTPLVNAAQVAGNIALVDRGTCGFTVKVKNAQNAGAIGVIVADNVAGGPPAGMGGVDPTITIPSVRITLDDGNKLRANLPAAVLLGVDLSVRAGADAQDRPLIFTPNPRQAGSSVSHWDTSAFPNLLMEPAINADLTHNLDLTEREMRDIGWFVDRDLDQIDDAVDQCTGSNLGNTVTIQGCDSGVTNQEFTTGCTFTDLVMNCANGARNHGGFVSCVAAVTNSLKSGGFITGDDKGKIQTCAANSSLP